MFTLSYSQFGHIPAIDISSADGSVRAKILTGYGAALQELVLKNPQGSSASVICGFQSPTAVEEEGGRLYRGTVLFPFVNRIRNGKYAFENKEYSLPANEASRGHALHGLVYDKPFEVKDQHLEENQATVVLERSISAAEHEGYPFDVRLELRFTLSEMEGLSCKASIFNTGQQKAPVTFGTHPYYTTGSSIDELLLRLPACRQVDCDDVLIPTGSYSEFAEYSEYKKLSHTFDTNFELDVKSGRQESVLMDSKNQIALHIWQGTGPGGLNYIQIYTHPDRKCIAIEPMSSEIDAFNTGKGLTVLEPGSCAEFNFGVYLH